ncbi:MAG: helix-turn-helix transcriptional regulator [Bacteroidota bacterium]
MKHNFNIPFSASLKNAVHTFWQTEGNTEFQTEIIIPKGIVEIIFNFSEQSTIHIQPGEIQNRLPRCFINGFNTRPIQLHLPRHQFFFGTRFHPTAIKSIFGVPAGEFANNSVDLTLVDPSLNSLWHQLIEQDSFDERVSLLSIWLMNRINKITNQDFLFNYFLGSSHQKIPSVTELSKTLFYSPRQLSRKMNELTGMNAEEVLLYKRYLQSLELIQHTKLSLTEIAYSCQFSDQSHFIKTFRSLAAMTPGEYRKSKGAIPGHIYKNVR